MVKVPRKRVFTPLSSSLKIATAKLLFLKLNSSMKIPKIIQRIMRWILLVGSPGWSNKYIASVISVLRITYCTFWLIQTNVYRLIHEAGFTKKAGKMSVKSQNFIFFFVSFLFFLRVRSSRERLWFMFTELLTVHKYTVWSRWHFWKSFDYFNSICMKRALANWECCQIITNR